jgi:hypothetical protein
MAATNGGHLDNIPFDQLDPLIRLQDAGLGHSVILFRRELSPRYFGLHFCPVFRVVRVTKPA